MYCVGGLARISNRELKEELVDYVEKYGKHRKGISNRELKAHRIGQNTYRAVAELMHLK